MISEQNFLRFCDRWKSLADFKKDLEAQSLSFEINQNTQDYLEKAWTSLGFPSSSNTQADKSKFCFVAGKLNQDFNLSDWGFAVVETKLSQDLELTNVILSETPELLIDFVLGECAAKAWFADKTYALPEHVKAEAGVIVGPDCNIAKGVVMECGVRIGARVTIGENTFIGAHTVIADDTVIGDDCYISSQVKIGGNGFGLLSDPVKKAPVQKVHAAHVTIGSGCRIGSFVTIDRGVLEDTQLGDFCCIDNLVHVGHNCVIGRGAILCGFVGLAGSTKLGDFVTAGGQASTKGHVEIGSFSTLAGRAGVTKDLPAKSVVKGFPAIPIAKEMKLEAYRQKLPNVFDRLKKLEQKNR